MRVNLLRSLLDVLSLVAVSLSGGIVTRWERGGSRYTGRGGKAESTDGYQCPDCGTRSAVFYNCGNGPRYAACSHPYDDP